jgi:glyoxylase-like metal-dependent hydrolase (beta-lactamase superfamily II)
MDGGEIEEERAMLTVTVLVEGYVKAIEGRQLIPGVSADGARHVAGTVTLIRDDRAIVVADPGMVTDRAFILEGLAKAGVAPEEVTHIFISHHHPDHTVNIALFPNAEVVDFWASYRGDLWRDHAEEYDIVPGITVLRTPGHTEEDASLIVRADDGTYVLTHLWWLEDMTPETDPLAWDQAKLEASRQKVLAIADWIIPGHGRVFKNPRTG